MSESRDYREKTVEGLFISRSIQPASATVRMTSDSKGKTLSFEANGVMIAIPVEKVSDIIKIAER